MPDFGLQLPETVAAENLQRWLSRGAICRTPGRPLLLWHGDIEYGVRDRILDREADGFPVDGVFFAEVPEQADWYDFASRAKLPGGPRAFYVRAANLLDLTRQGARELAFVNTFRQEFDEWVERQSGEAVDVQDLIDSGYLYDYEGDGTARRWNALFRLARNQGFDAVRILDATDGYTAPIVVSFDPRQIKSATWNSGHFSGESNDCHDQAEAFEAPPIEVTHAQALELADRMGVSVDADVLRDNPSQSPIKY